jgi:hypothetical protein
VNLPQETHALIEAVHPAACVEGGVRPAAARKARTHRICDLWVRGHGGRVRFVCTQRVRVRLRAARIGSIARGDARLHHLTRQRQHRRAHPERIARRRVARVWRRIEHLYAVREAISGNQSQSEALRGNLRPTEERLRLSSTRSI